MLLSLAVNINAVVLPSKQELGTHPADKPASRRTCLQGEPSSESEGPPVWVTPTIQAFSTTSLSPERRERNFSSLASSLLSRRGQAQRMWQRQHPRAFFSILIRKSFIPAERTTGTGATECWLAMKSSSEPTEPGFKGACEEVPL